MSPCHDPRAAEDARAAQEHHKRLESIVERMLGDGKVPERWKRLLRREIETFALVRERVDAGQVADQALKGARAAWTKKNRGQL